MEVNNTSILQPVRLLGWAPAARYIDSKSAKTDFFTDSEVVSAFSFPTARLNYFSHPLTLLLLHTFKGFTLLWPRKIKQLQPIAI